MYLGVHTIVQTIGARALRLWKGVQCEIRAHVIELPRVTFSSGSGYAHSGSRVGTRAEILAVRVRGARGDARRRGARVAVTLVPGEADTGAAGLTLG
eukprot:2657998-Rhodomonas_salina.1